MGDMRNEGDIELARARGAYLDTVPESWIGNPFIWLEPKYDGCFCESTPILMSDNSWKAIRDVRVGDWVRSFSADSHRLTNSRVSALLDNGLSSYWVKVVVRGEDGGLVELVCTPQHPFYSDGEWISAENMAGKKVLLDPPSVLALQRATVSHRTLEHRLRMKEIVDRKMQKKFPRLFEDSFLVQRYVRDQASLGDIALEVGCSVQAVLTALQRAKIGVRSVKESHNSIGRRAKFVGECNPSWRGGHTNYRGVDWHEQRRRALARANGVCEKCGKSGVRLSVHHKIPWAIYRSNALPDLIVLCNSCHRIEECRFIRSCSGSDIPVRREFLDRLSKRMKKSKLNVDQLTSDYTKMLDGGRNRVLSELSRIHGVSKTTVVYWLRKRGVYRVFLGGSVKRGVVTSVSPVDGVFRRWNLSVEKTESFFAGGVLVHNCRLTLQFDHGRNWAISRNREDKLKGVDKAGPFVDKSESLPHLCQELQKPDLAGAMLDGELVMKDDDCGRGASVISYMKDNPKGLVLRAFDLIFGPGAEDLRAFPLKMRRHKLQELVAKINSPFIEMTPRLEPTMLEIHRLWDAGWEGGILKDSRSFYRGTNAMYKVKAENPVDAFVIGAIPERRGGSPKNGIKPQPTGRAGGFIMGMRHEGKVVKVGFMMQNVPDEDRDHGLKDLEKYKGRVARMTVSGWNGSEFRWCRFHSWYPEKSSQDCLLEEQVGEEAELVEA